MGWADAFEAVIEEAEESDNESNPCRTYYTYSESARTNIYLKSIGSMLAAFMDDQAPLCCMCKVKVGHTPMWAEGRLPVCHQCYDEAKAKFKPKEAP